MSKQVTITYEITYDLTDGEIAKEYREWRDDYRDSKERRKWFVIDRFVGHHNLPLFDRKAQLKVEES
jgi:hypothetical protein